MFLRNLLLADLLRARGTCPSCYFGCGEHATACPEDPSWVTSKSPRPPTKSAPNVPHPTTAPVSASGAWPTGEAGTASATVAAIAGPSLWRQGRIRCSCGWWSRLIVIEDAAIVTCPICQAELLVGCEDE